jgi:hypothetical protein
MLKPVPLDFRIVSGEQMQIESVHARPTDTPIEGFDPRPVEAALNHPSVRALKRYAANQMGPQAKKKTMKHLQGCCECQSAVTEYRNVGRRFRELERAAIAALGAVAKK